MNLLNVLLEERNTSYKGGIYHNTQINFTYNTNRIEGSKLSQEQTRYIFETNTLFLEEGQQTSNVDDILETVNHFSCFDYMLDIADRPLNETQIKTLHKLLKSNTSDAKKSWFNIRDYKTQPNVVGGMETTHPEEVSIEMKKLLEVYNKKIEVKFEDIIDFHFQFESIHPFQDGNGRVGRLIMFKECLRHQILPFIIEDEYKMFYYRGLSEYSKVKGYLLDTCLAAQDNYKTLFKYFFPDNMR